MEDCIIISDDEDVELLEHVVNFEPIVIDLTKTKIPSVKPQPAPTLHQPKSTAPAPPPQSETLFSEPVPPPSPQSPPQPSFPTQPQSEPQSEPQFNAPTPPSECSSSTPSPPSEPQSSPAPPQLEPRISPPAPQLESQTLPRTPPVKPVIDEYKLMLAQKDLGNEKYRNNLFNDAVEVYRRANQLAKKLNDLETSSKIHFNLAMTYFKLGSFNQAIDECANASKIDENYLKAHLKRAEIYLRQGKFEEAVICYEHICELDSTNRDYKILLQKAREDAKRVRKKDSFQVLGLNSAFITHDKLKKAYRQQALSHHPDRHSSADVVTRKIEEKKFKDASVALKSIEAMFGFNR